MEDKVKEYLDTIDIGNFLLKDRMISDVMDEIDAIYSGDYERMTGDSNFLASWSQYDFVSYIKEEYGVKCYEQPMWFIK